MSVSRSEHLTWCKERALEYVNMGDNGQAMASMGSDLNKHPDTKDHPGMEIGLILLMNGDLNGKDAMRRFIEGFN